MASRTSRSSGRLARPLADMIVIGTHGRTGLAKLFLGSVAGRVDRDVSRHDRPRQVTIMRVRD